MKTRKRFAFSLFVVFIAILFFLRCARAQKPDPDDLLVLTNVTGVDVRTGVLQSEQTVILNRHRVASLERSKAARYPRNAPGVNCRGLVLSRGPCALQG